MFSPYYMNTAGKRSRSGLEESDHEDFSERLRKTLYFGKPPTTDRPSLPLTDIAVELFQEVAPRELGKLDTYFAASSARHACMSPCAVTMGMIYAKRLHKRNNDYVQQISSSELFLISMMMASKFMYDEGIDEEVFNDEWAAAGDLETEDMNTLEREFLFAMDWQLFVHPGEFESMLHLIEKRIALTQGLDRGWFSYSDLWVLSQDIYWAQICQDFGADLTQVLAVTSLAYLAGFLTMIGSTILVTTATTSLSSLILSANESGLFSPKVPVLPLPDFKLPTLVLPLISGAGEINMTPNASVDTIVMSEHTAANQSSFDGGDSNKATETPNDNENLGSVLGMDKILSHLFTLITLKDAFIDFMYAIQDKQSGIKKNSHSTRISDLVCSDGLCPIDTWTNCWNMTKERPNTLETLHLYRKQISLQNCHRNPVLYNYRRNKMNGLDSGQGSKQCCCKVIPAYDTLDGQASVFSDRHFGFMTDSFLPLHVNT